MEINLINFETIESTNTEALTHARQGAKEGLCILARQQTGGRGRQGRTWVSDADAGLYYSIVLRPRLDPGSLTLITLMAGVAVHATLTEFGLSPDIKWVNDILIHDRKISGILAETTDTAEGLAVVVGVGINIRSSNFPPEIAETATSIENVSKNSEWNQAPVPTPAQLAQVLTNYIRHFYSILHEKGGSTEILDEWSRRSTFFSGRRVRVAVGDQVITGLTDGLESNGALRIRKDDGRIAVIQAGDVERLRPVEPSGASRFVN